MPMKTYVVETKFYGGSWENCWHTDGVPTTFSTEAEAEAEIEELIADLENAEDLGLMQGDDEGMTKEFYRVMEVEA
tara:strand:- start:45 stop:272 length:228 start_codon:yes stop_codon:yes gene_type:complete